ncbi:MAG: UDP-galactopyranose mutase [Lachnospiraceae bacterium]|nr:UDP-galactopyranose mutase [Lachnospiraceae bacterium]
MNYDYLIVGAGLFGAVFAHEATKAGKKCLVIEKRNHIAGNIYTEESHGIAVHKYGAHIFHTSDEEVWEYVTKFADFNHYVNSPVARYKDELYNLPFNMNTFAKMWNIKTPAEAKAKIAEQIAEAGITEPKNLEEQAISLAGRDVYEKLIKGYTEKQWGKSCTELPSFIIKRLPLRFVFDNNYFKDPHQGIPKEGYTAMVAKMLDGIEVLCDTEFRAYAEPLAEGGYKNAQGDTFAKLVYTGMIDEFYDYRLGELEYRSLRFETEYLPEEDNYQGNAVINYTEREVPYTRIIEHKHFTFGGGEGTYVTREYPATWQKGDEPYYPMNNDKNNELYKAYRALAEEDRDVIFGGRLGMYQYFDMDKVVRAALDTWRAEAGQ